MVTAYRAEKEPPARCQFPSATVVRHYDCIQWRAQRRQLPLLPRRRLASLRCASDHAVAPDIPGNELGHDVVVRLRPDLQHQLLACQ